MMSRTAEIKLTVALDAESLPTRIEWQATDSEEPGPKSCQSMMLSLWDADQKTAAVIDLWTKETTIEDMNLYFYEVFQKMADTYMRATKNRVVADSIHEFGNGFARSLGLR
jgi:gliding motility-associated protein GldC